MTAVQWTLFAAAVSVATLLHAPPLHGATNTSPSAELMAAYGACYLSVTGGAALPHKLRM